jgi:hypothetical protein
MKHDAAFFVYLLRRANSLHDSKVQEGVISILDTMEFWRFWAADDRCIFSLLLVSSEQNNYFGSETW